MSLMKRAGVWLGFPFLVIALAAAVVGATGAAQGGRGEAGWTVPPTAASEKNPLTVDAALLASGKKLFGDKCARCHGLRGKGDGPDGDESHQADMDLTVAARAARNPDGVVFYKIWNGRPSVKMDPMSGALTKDQVWTIVAYVQGLRAKASNRP
jgi:mono/diheme cytochrome c family protein